MPKAQRVGDANGAGGVARTGVSSVRVNNRPIIVVGNPVTPHPCCGSEDCPSIHCSARTSGGSKTVRAGNIRIVRTGDSDNCGHARAGGSGDVRVGG